MFFSSQQRQSLGSLTSLALGLSSYLLAATFGYTPVAQAQVGASPLVIQVQAQRGRAQGIITIKNTTSQPSRVRIYTEPFTYKRDTGFETLAESERDLAPYLRFSPREMTIPPESERRVRLLAQLPPSIADGEYRTAVFAESLIEAIDAQQNVVGIIARVAVTVYIWKGELQPNLKVESASYNDAENRIELLVNNFGETSVLPRAVWKLTQAGQTIKQGESPKTTVIAQSERNLFISLVDRESPDNEELSSLAPGVYQLSGELIWGTSDNSNTLPFELNLTVPD